MRRRLIRREDADDFNEIIYQRDVNNAGIEPVSAILAIIFLFLPYFLLKFEKMFPIVQTMSLISWGLALLFGLITLSIKKQKNKIEL